jgi:hypothetical protein
MYAEESKQWRLNEVLKNGTVDGRSLPDVLYALATWKAKHLEAAKPRSYTPEPVQPTTLKTIISG